jgi:transcriptional regulator with XRE-family HTH domain
MAEQTAAAAAPDLTIGLRIKILRTRQRRSLAALAGATGIPESTLRHYERGRAQPPIDKLEALARALESTPNVLLGWDRLTLEKHGRESTVVPLPGLLSGPVAVASPVPLWDECPTASGPARLDDSPRTR